MKLPKKLLLTVLSIGAVIALALFGWSAKAKNDAAFHLANGVEITPIEVKSDDMSSDMADILDVKIYKFNVVLPRPNKLYWITLNSVHQGEIESSKLGGSGIHTGIGVSQGPVTISLAPENGDFLNANTVKYRIAYGTGIGSGTFKNPFKNCKGICYNKTGAESGGLIYLIGGSRGSSRVSLDPAQSDIALALTVTTAGKQ